LSVLLYNHVSAYVNTFAYGFYYQTGKMALGSRLRRLSEKFTEDAAKFMPYDIAFDPKWFPPLRPFAKERVSITEIAQIIGHSHPSVSQIVKEMTNIGLTTTAKSVSDARVNVVKLSDRGQQLIPTIKNQCIDVTQGGRTC